MKTFMVPHTRLEPSSAPGPAGRRRARPILTAAGVGVLGVLLTMALSHAAAHAKWFFEGEQPPLDPASALGFPNVLFVLGALLVTALAWGLWRVRGGRSFLPGPASFGATDEGKTALYALLPAILGVHLAVPLLVNGVQGQLFSPDNPLGLPWAYLFGLVQTGIALSFFYGGFTRAAAVLLALLWLGGALVVGLEEMLENLHFLGFAVFFFLAGRGPFAVDRLVFPRLEPAPHLMRRALVFLRVGVGLSLITVAFTEKLANVPLGLQFLQDHPLNFTAALGVPLPDTGFVLLAGTVELLVGLLLLFGIFPREVILVAWLPFNLTLTAFNWVELIGHLPIYGTLAALFIWTPTPHERRLWVRGLRRGLPDPAPTPASTAPPAPLEDIRTT